MFKNILSRLSSQTSEFQPYLPPEVDQNLIIQQAVDYFHLTLAQVTLYHQTYKVFHQEKDYARLLGERKTLSFEEAFLLYLCSMQVKPTRVVEIGTHIGRSTRRIIDLLGLLNFNSHLVGFDVVDLLKYVTREEIDLHLTDVTGHARELVFEKYQPGLIFLDARPYYLLKNVITDFIEWSSEHKTILAIHDCTHGLYNPRMTIAKEDGGAVTSHTGVWERHVLSEIFGIPNEAVDEHITGTHHLKIFGTPHGLAILSPINSI